MHKDECGTFSSVGDTLSLSELTLQDATIVVNFRGGERVRYYAPMGDLLMARVKRSRNYLKEKITKRCIEISTKDHADDSDESSGEYSILVSPLEVFKILTIPQMKKLECLHLLHLHLSWLPFLAKVLLK